jgi:hypothetical protein
LVCFCAFFFIRASITHRMGPSPRAAFLVSQSRLGAELSSPASFDPSLVSPACNHHQTRLEWGVIERDECIMISDACGTAVAAGRSTSSVDRRIASPSQAAASPSLAAASPSGGVKRRRRRRRRRIPGGRHPPLRLPWTPRRLQWPPLRLPGPPLRLP